MIKPAVLVALILAILVAPLGAEAQPGARCGASGI